MCLCFLYAWNFIGRYSVGYLGQGQQKSTGFCLLEMLSLQAPQLRVLNALCGGS